jgi:hypothetical protein
MTWVSPSMLASVTITKVASGATTAMVSVISTRRGNSGNASWSEREGQGVAERPEQPGLLQHQAERGAARRAHQLEDREVVGLLERQVVDDHHHDHGGGEGEDHGEQPDLHARALDHAAEQQASSSSCE